VAGGQSQVTWAKMAKNLPHLYCHPQKKQNPKPNLFFIANWKTSCISSGFEQLTSTINWRVMELQSGVKIAANARAQGMNEYIYIIHWW